MSFVQNHKTKRKTQFAFCYLHVDLKREPPFAPPPLVLTLAQPQTRGLCMLRNIDSDAARCLAWRCTGMGHDTATTPSINLMCRGRGQHWDFRFSTATQWDKDRAKVRSSPSRGDATMRLSLIILWGHVVIAEDPGHVTSQSLKEERDSSKKEQMLKIIHGISELLVL